jgi:hypothetical protein
MDIGEPVSPLLGRLVFEETSTTFGGRWFCVQGYQPSIFLPRDDPVRWPGLACGEDLGHEELRILVVFPPDLRLGAARPP